MTYLLTHQCLRKGPSEALLITYLLTHQCLRKGPSEALLITYLLTYQCLRKGPSEALLWFHAAGTLSTLSRGAQSALTTPREISDFLHILTRTPLAESLPTPLLLDCTVGPESGSYLHLAVLRGDLAAIWRLLPSTQLLIEQQQAREGQGSRGILSFNERTGQHDYIIAATNLRSQLEWAGGWPAQLLTLRLAS